MDQHIAEVVDGDSIRLVRRMSPPPERVWRALIEPDELESWMGRTFIEPRVGGRVHFFLPTDADVGDHTGTIFVFDPPRSLAYSFKQPNRESRTDDWTVRWDLEPDGDGTLLTLTHRWLDGPAMCGLADGWHGFIDALEAHLRGGPDEVAALAARGDVLGTHSPAALASYRGYMTRALIAFAESAAQDARTAVPGAIDRLETSVQRLGEIALADEAGGPAGTWAATTAQYWRDQRS